MNIKIPIENVYFYRLFDIETNESMILCSDIKYSDDEFLSMVDKIEKEPNDEDFEKGNIFDIAEELVSRYKHIDFVYDVESYYFEKGV